MGSGLVDGSLVADRRKFTGTAVIAPIRPRILIANCIARIRGTSRRGERSTWVFGWFEGVLRGLKRFEEV